MMTTIVKTTLNAAALVAGLTLASSAASAGVIIVDNFSASNTGGAAITDNTVNGSGPSVTDAPLPTGDTIGGRRVFSVSATSLASSSHNVSASVDTDLGEFNFASTNRGAGDGLLTWGDLGVNQLNLDLSAAVGFEVDVTSFDFANDLSIQLTIKLYDGLTVYSSTQTLSAEVAALTTLSYTLGSFAGIGVLNLANIDRIDLLINGARASDLTLSEIRIDDGFNIEIPEPASLSLLSLGALALVRRRR